MHQRILGAGAEGLDGLDPVIPHPRTQLLGGPEVEGSPQHEQQRLAAADGCGRWIGQSLPD